MAVVYKAAHPEFLCIGAESSKMLEIIALKGLLRVLPLIDNASVLNESFQYKK